MMKMSVHILTTDMRHWREVGMVANQGSEIETISQVRKRLFWGVAFAIGAVLVCGICYR
ncbi:hypothetical protein Lalb_Chr04g0254821 [Lupinus albus]|uniref:Uncharacterized protein n=1 Tax=Lupinus albus TaxID=3870 RepID=A0A6A4QN98_LUPAL|nr:hypothetical protein Lalb_Chr04g0254821 [Lupinus albus]